MSASLQSPELCRVRAVTAFVVLSSERSSWPEALAEAKRQCDRIAASCQAAGYTVQSVRIVANPFGEYLDTRSLEAARAGLAEIQSILQRLNQNGLRIRFAIGEARTPEEIALLPGLIRDYGDLSNACVNVEADEQGFLDNAAILRCVDAMQEIAQITPRGEGNFNFTVNFNCAPLIPYFPAGYHRGEQGKCLVLGLETPDLLAAALRTLPAAEAPRPSSGAADEAAAQTPAAAERATVGEAQIGGLAGGADHAGRFQEAFRVMVDALQHHVDAVQRCVRATPLEPGWSYVGMDTSAAPSKSCTSMVEIYRLLGVPFFGAAGTVEASALLTRVFKSLQDVQAVGFSGLMLAVTEDEGLAEATRAGHFDIRALLTYSSVCGIGLDTVPIPGDVPPGKMAALMRDTGTMAFRLNKPLTVRLFPVPGLAAGDITRFESDDLCNCAVLAVP